MSADRFEKMKTLKRLFKKHGWDIDELVQDPMDSEIVLDVIDEYNAIYPPRRHVKGQK